MLPRQRESLSAGSPPQTRQPYAVVPGWGAKSTTPKSECSLTQAVKEHLAYYSAYQLLKSVQRQVADDNSGNLDGRGCCIMTPGSSSDATCAAAKSLHQ